MLTKSLHSLLASLSVLLATVPVIQAVTHKGASLQIEDNTNKPIIDLGYALYRPTEINATGQYYNFSNIRFAAPPVGDLRWRDPQPPLEDRSKINDGKLGHTCPQSVPAYFVEAAVKLGNALAVIPPGGSGQTQDEDCLFLDVIAPMKFFGGTRRKNGKKPNLAPVLVNIHGGGYWQGDKTAIYNPRGLLERADNGFVYVSMNYRLGALGFLSNLEKSDANETSPNAGFLDQRYALKWVQKNIHLFGGDAKKVTITGESAGGGIVEQNTIAYGGAKENDLFIQGIAQSPAPLIIDPVIARMGANMFLQNAGVRSVDEARKLPSDVLVKAQSAAQMTAGYSIQYYAPTIDGDVFLDIPARLYNEGKYIKNLSMIAAHNADEGRLFSNSSIKSDEEFNATIYYNFPSAPKEFTDRLINEIYPPVFNGLLPYTDNAGRIQLAIKEFFFSCNTHSIARAYPDKAWNYIFSIPPALHGQDLAYTYYPTDATAGFFPEVALTFQELYVNFVLTGNPNGLGKTSSADQLPRWPRYSNDEKVLNITTTGLEETRSDAANDRCEYLLRGTWYIQP